MGVLGQETTGPGRHLLRAAHDPGDGASSPRRSPRARRSAWLINFTNPAGMVTEAIQQVLGDRAVGICDSPSGLCRRVAARARARRPTSCGSTTSASTTSAGCAACTTASATCCPSLLADDERLDVVRGGPAVRRRVAALARDDPERVPLLLLLRVRHGRRDPSAREPRGEFLLAAAGGVLRRERPHARRGARGLARDPRRARAHLHGRGARAAGRRRRARRRSDVGGYEGEAMAVRRGDRASTRARC